MPQPTRDAMLEIRRNWTKRWDLSQSNAERANLSHILIDCNILTNLLILSSELKLRFSHSALCQKKCLSYVKIKAKASSKALCGIVSADVRARLLTYPFPNFYSLFSTWNNNQVGFYKDVDHGFQYFCHNNAKIFIIINISLPAIFYKVLFA